jgi:ROS/MUCR transcriptional regulator protein
MRHTRQQKRFAPQPRKTTSADGVDFVRCRICGDRRRVISGRHLSKHGTDREEYMQEYGLSPDELIAKDFRIIQSSRHGYQPYGKKDWIAAIKRVYKRDGNVFARRLQDRHPHLYTQGVWFLAIRIRLCVQRDSIPKRCGCAGSGISEK